MERPDQGTLDRGVSARLRCLQIEDFGLLARAELPFADGVTICSGETGSGKSMLLGALEFALGARASADVVRGGCARARVSLEIEPDAALCESLRGEGFEAEDEDVVVLSREMSAAGKSSARINGRAATTAQLRALGERVVDFIGQHEQQRLLAPGYQADLLDRFAGEDALRARERVATLDRETRRLKAEIEEREQGEERLRSEFEVAGVVLAEIDEAALREGEDVELRERREYLLNAERIAGALSSAHAALSDGEGAATEVLGAVVTALSGAARFGRGLAELHEAATALQSEAGELAAAITRELERTEFDAQEAERIGARLDLIERLKRKHGGSIEAVLAARERAARIVEGYESRDERLAALRAEWEHARTELMAAAASLTRARTKAARRLEQRMAKELADLAMPAARLTVALEPLREISARGAERVELLLAPNPGEPARPLAKTASGGELSRVLLALVVLSADREQRKIFVFDEIDAGIGGATASAVGARLGTLARSAQILCVTHLAQIAAWADTHLVLEKRQEKEATRIQLRPLAERGAVRHEIARMLSGSTTAVALDHAEVLLSEAKR